MSSLKFAAMLTVVMAVECGGLILNTGVTRYSNLIDWHDELIQIMIFE